MLPKMNGFDVLRKLRETSKLPVIMLTARGDDMERIVGLEIGADDYLPKPFNPRELAARLRAILRRATSDGDGNGTFEKMDVDGIQISSASRTAILNGADLNLTSVEFELLRELLREAGKVVKKEDLSQKVLERELSPYDRSLDMHISNLRKKLGARLMGPTGSRPSGQLGISTPLYEAVSEDLSLVFSRHCLDGRCGYIRHENISDGTDVWPLAARSTGSA